MFNLDYLKSSPDSFIPSDLTIAPKHLLAKNFDFPLPNYQQVSPSEIQALQRLKNIPGVVKRIIPFDHEISWEYWWCVPGRLLLAEDVTILNQDRPRLEKILAKLIWLYGGCCFNQGSCCQGKADLIYDWETVLHFASEQGFNRYFLDVDFFPMACKLMEEKNAEGDSLVAVEPAHWHIEFFQLQAVEGGFEIIEPKPPCSCQVWTGSPFVKNLNTGEQKIRYDLWVSSPLNITNPSWLGE